MSQAAGDSPAFLEGGATPLRLQTSYVNGWDEEEWARSLAGEQAAGDREGREQ